MAISDEKKFESIRRCKENLIARLKKNCVKNPNGCILAQGHANEGGHVNIKWRDSELGTDKHGKGLIVGVQAHRLSWIIANNRMPAPDEVVRHKCDTPSCINPDHLHVGSRGQNLIDAYKSGQHGTAKLNESKVREIRRLYSQGVPTTQIAKHYDINQKSAWEAATGKSYEWVK